MASEATFAAFLMTESPELRERSGLRDRVTEGTVVTQVLDPGPAYRELDGSIPFGYLSFLVDTAVGVAARVGSGWEVGGVSNALAFETITTLGAGPITARAEATAFSATAATAAGVLVGADGSPLGQATLRSVPVPGRATARIEPGAYEHVDFEWASSLEPAPIDRSIGLGLVHGEGSATVRTLPQLHWASAYGALHGGAVGLFVHRAIHYAVTAALPEGVTHTPIAFDVAFVRPAVCGPDPIECKARIISTSKRFVLLEAAMVLPSGKPAALVRATHAITRRDTQT